LSRSPVCSVLYRRFSLAAATVLLAGSAAPKAIAAESFSASRREMRVFMAGVAAESSVASKFSHRAGCTQFKPLGKEPPGRRLLHLLLV